VKNEYQAIRGLTGGPHAAPTRFGLKLLAEGKEYFICDCFWAERINSFVEAAVESVELLKKWDELLGLLKDWRKAKGGDSWRVRRPGDLTQIYTEEKLEEFMRSICETGDVSLDLALEVDQLMANHGGGNGTN